MIVDFRILRSPGWIKCGCVSCNGCPNLMSAAELRLRLETGLSHGLLRKAGIGRSTDRNNGDSSSLLLISARAAVCEEESSSSPKVEASTIRGEYESRALTLATAIFEHCERLSHVYAGLYLVVWSSSLGQYNHRRDPGAIEPATWI